MIIHDGFLEVLLGAIFACMGWVGRKLSKLAVDVELIKQRLHMR